MLIQCCGWMGCWTLQGKPNYQFNPRVLGQLAPEAKEKTAFVTHSGVQHFVKMSFGWHGAAFLQRVKDKVLLGVCVCARLCSCLYWCASHDGLKIRMSSGSLVPHVSGPPDCLLDRRFGEKSQLGKQMIQYLWFRIWQGKIRAIYNKVVALNEAVWPHSK